MNKKVNKKKSSGIMNFIDSVIFNNRNNLKNVRPVYLGIRIRLVFFLGLLLLALMLITLLSFYILQTRAIYKEKDNKALSLTQMLSSSAEFYLDKDIHTTRAQRLEKYNRIKETSENFMEYNGNIFKIVLTDESGINRYSTYGKDIGHKTNGSYLLKALDEKEAVKYDFEHVEGEEVYKYRAVAYPIFLTKGSIVDILEDFDTYYERFHKAKLKGKQSIYLALWKKYKDNLGEDFNPQGKKSSATTITKYNDIDFLFLQLFVNVIKDRQRRAKKGEAYLWSFKWLYGEKNKIIAAYQNNIPEDAFKANELIKERLTYMKEQIDQIRLLGAVAILFDMNSITAEVNGTIKTILIVIATISVIGLIFFFILISFLVKNIKELEKGALLIGEGEFDTPIAIPTTDEIGRLSDILNNTAIHLKEKLHMEKFVSKSTKKMITDSRNYGKDINPGSVYRVPLSFIFADVRGFTAFSENHDPAEVIDTLNLYFDLQYKVVRRFNGDVDDYVGDQIMAHFSGPNHHLRSCKAAVGMMKAIKAFNAKQKKANRPFFEIGIGVHSGTVVVGNIGSKARMDFACVGDSVNTTSRLCGKANPGEILVSKEHTETIKSSLVLKNTPSIEAKGKQEKISVFKLIDTK